MKGPMVIRWPDDSDRFAVVGSRVDEDVLPTSEAVAMVRFVLARLREDEASLRAKPDLWLARRIGATRSLAEAWLDYCSPDGEVEVEGWDRGFADGILLGLLAAAYPYRDHPDWQEDWA